MSFFFISITEFIGRFHPLVVHLPIGILLLALLLQWLSRKEQYTLSHGLMKVIWLIGALSALVACITGYLLSLSDDYEDDAVSLHMWTGIGVAAVSLFICTKVFNRQFDTLYKVAALLLLLLIVAAGHYGGTLTHGDDYLLSGFDDTPTTDTVAFKPIANVQEATVYTDVVQPVLQTKCYGCHGPKKQKGKLRLDKPEFIVKGGEEDNTLVPGKAEESELIKRLLLPREHEDRMPPKQKPQLTKHQIALLHWWIEQGAPFDKKVKDLPQPEKVKPVLLALQNRHKEKKETVPLLPATPVEAADGKAVATLEKKGVVILPVAQNSHYLMANFVTASAVSDRDMQLLLPLKKQLVGLKLGNTKISDSALFVIGQCTNLRMLQLNNTAVTDKGLAGLRSLKNLQSLNLIETKVTLKGVLSLRGLPLQSLYLYQTAINETDWGLLKKAFPKTVLDTGGYTVPLLPTDTTLLKANYQP